MCCQKVRHDLNSSSTVQVCQSICLPPRLDNLRGSVALTPDELTDVVVDFLKERGMKAGKEFLIKKAKAAALDLVGACGLATAYAYVSEAWDVVQVGRLVFQ